MKKDILSGILDFIFSKNNVKYLVILFIIGMILRVIFAFYMGGSPDEMVYGVHALGIINSGLLQEMHENQVWMYLTDIGYKLFGMTLVSSRLMSIIFGSLSILVLYFLTKEMFNKKTALISSLLFTFSSYHIIMTLTELDITMMFFILLSSYFLIKYLKDKRLIDYIISIVFLGIGILTKNIGALFIPVYLLMILFYPKLKDKSKVISKENMKKILIFFLIIFVISLPILTFNYILYKEKDLTDLQFSRFFSGDNKGIYESIANTIQPFSLNVLLKDYGNGTPGIIQGLNFYLNYSIFLFIGFIIGIPIILKKNKLFGIYLLLIFIIPFLFLSGTSLLEKHFVFAVPIFCIFSSLTIEKISSFSKKNSRLIVVILILIFLVISFISLYNTIKNSGKNPIQKTIEYKQKYIEKNSLVIVDSRIYSGRIAFIFNDRNYLETNYLSQLISQLNKPTNQKIKTYFIECVTDDCGWGTINSQQDLNISTEKIVSNFKKVSTLKKTIYSNKEPYLNIYETELPLLPNMIEAIQSTHSFFFYPVNYKPKESIILRYESKNFFHKLLDFIAHIILYIEVLIATISIGLTIKLLRDDYKNEIIDNNASL